MTGVEEYLLIIVITWGVRTLADLGVRYSKRTENTVDDVIFSNFKKVANFLNFKKK